jgi:hypothetical protein
MGQHKLSNKLDRGCFGQVKQFLWICNNCCCGIRLGAALFHLAAALQWFWREERREQRRGAIQIVELVATMLPACRLGGDSLPEGVLSRRAKRQRRQAVAGLN